MKTSILKSITILLLFVGAAMGVNGQQLTLFNNNIANPFSINPSQAGMEGSKLFFQHRRQWIGVQGAPEKTLFTSEWRMKESKTALGFSFGRDESNVIANTSAYATVASHFPLKKTHQLSFGASVGVRHNSIDFAGVNVIDAGDDLVFENRQNSTNFDAKFGLSYRFKGLEVQASALQLFGNKTVYDNSFDGNFLEYTFVRHFVTSAGYRFQAGKDIGIKPIVQVKGIQGSRLQPEAIMRLDYKKNLWAAVHYVYQSSAAVTVGAAIDNTYLIGYSAEFSTSQFANYNGGTHELMFGINLGAFKKGKSDKQFQKMEKSLLAYDERQQYMQEENNRMQAEIEAQRERIKALKTNAGELDYDEVRRILADETAKLRKEIEELKEFQANNPVQAGSNGTSQPINAAPLPEGVVPATQDYYVVIATAKGPKRAQKFVRKAEKNYSLKTFIVHPVNNPYYFISSNGYDDREAARAELLRIFRMNTAKEFNGRPWIYDQ